MRILKIKRDDRGLIKTEFIFIEIDASSRVWHTITSYQWVPPLEIVEDWIDRGKHPEFTHT